MMRVGGCQTGKIGGQQEDKTVYCKLNGFVKKHLYGLKRAKQAIVHRHFIIGLAPNYPPFAHPLHQNIPRIDGYQ